ncbi:MAG: 3-oxoacyl-[acyl-carrier-protein] reductase [Planctomycetota bacterium]
MSGGELRGRTALVTGASRGIGQAIALGLAKRGANILCVATGLPGLAATMEKLSSCQKSGEFGEDQTFHAFAADVSSADSVRALLDAIDALGLEVDTLVNNAGITRDNLLMRMSDEDFDRVLAVNLRGTFLLCRALARAMMRARAGSIVNIASVVGLAGNAGQANYAASKAGIIGFTKSLARELAGRGVTANVVAPGLIETDMTRDIPEVNRTQLMSAIPLGRFGVPEDVAEAVLFFVGPGAAYVTGQVLCVDGGMAL